MSASVYGDDWEKEKDERKKPRVKAVICRGLFDRLVPSWNARENMEQWMARSTPLDLNKLPSADLEKPFPVLARFGDEFSYGTLERVPFLEEPVYLLTENKEGRIHIIFPGDKTATFFDARDLPSVVEHAAKGAKAKKQYATETEEAWKRLCAQMGGLAKAKPNDSRLQKLDALAAKVNRQRLVTAYTKHCGINGGGGTGAFVALDAALYDDQRRDLYSNHRSNFMLGLVLMGGMHACLAMASPASSKLMLAAALGGDLAGNIYFELGMGQKDLDGAPVKTDWPDFAAGTAAIALYAIYGSMLEKRLGGKFATFCR